MDKAPYSADVRMWLSVKGRVLPIAQLGPDFLTLDETADHPPAEAEIALPIDGHEKRWLVYLPDGLAVGKAETRMVRAGRKTAQDGNRGGS